MVNEQLNDWLDNGNRGLSSEAIASKMTGIHFVKTQIGGLPYPSDPSDFNRCVSLLKAVPEFKERFEEMREVSETWNMLVDNWDELEQLLIEESAIGPLAPKLYDRMKELGC